MPLYLSTEKNDLVKYDEIDESLFNSFLDYIDVSQNSLKTYKNALRRFSMYLEENEIKKPIRQDILNYKEELKQNYKPATAQIYLTTVRIFFKWLSFMGLYPNIADNIKGIKITGTHKKDALTLKQVRDLLSAIKRENLQGKRDYILILLMITGGLREIELRRANLEDLQLLNGETVLYIQGKNRDDKSEYIKIMPQVLEPLADYLSRRPDAEGADPLFISLCGKKIGGRLKEPAIGRIVRNYLKKAGCYSERITPHSLRHTAITLALLGGAGLDEVCQFARHRDIATTQIYMHHLERNKNRCENIITNSIFKTIKEE